MGPMGPRFDDSGEKSISNQQQQRIRIGDHDNVLNLDQRPANLTNMVLVLCGYDFLQGVMSWLEFGLSLCAL